MAKVVLQKVFLHYVAIEKVINVPLDYSVKKNAHDNVKKTIFYEHALIKVYSIPIFYIPRLSHPDPTVERRSGFLPPTLYTQII